MLADFVRCSNGRELAAKMRAEGDLHAVISDACNWFNGQVCLFVVDDIWKTAIMPRSIIQELSRLCSSSSGVGTGSRIAYSTRQKEISDATGGSTVRFMPREPLGDASRSMLFTAAQLDYKHMHDARFKSHVDEILLFCAGLPFTLSLAGRLISDINREWNAEMREETFKICAEKVRGIGILNMRGESYFNALQVSIDHLDSTHDDNISYADAVKSFCVLRKQDSVPLSVCRHMWAISSPEVAEELVKSLSMLGIVETEYRKIEERNVRCLRFHDHVQSYALWLAEQGGDKMRWFNQVVHSYRITFENLPDGKCWPAMLEEDGYAVQNICRIMLGAGLADEVATILCSGQWVTKMMSTGQILQYEQDVRDWTKYTDGTGATDGEDVRAALGSLAKIFRLSYPDCVGHPHAAWFQLYARLRSVHAPKKWMKTIMREAERHAPRPFVQARSACLHFPSDALLDVHRVKLPACDARWLCDGTLAVFGCYYRVTEMSAALLKSGMPPIEKEFRTAGSITQECSLGTACLSPNGTIVYSGHEDGTIRTWDVTTGNQISAWKERHCGPIHAICVCSDGSRLASGSDDCTVRVWDIASGDQVGKELTGHEDYVRSVSMSADGSRVASGSHDCTVRVWDVVSGEQVCHALIGHDDHVQSVRMSSDGSRVASGSKDRTVRVWDTASGDQVGDALTGHESWVQCVSMSEDGWRVASGSLDRTLRVWDLASGTPVGVAFTGHENSVQCVSMSGDGARVVSGSDDCTVRVWDVASGAPVRGALTRQNNAVQSVSISGDGSRAASGSKDGTVRVWDLASGRPVTDALTGHEHSVECVSMNGDGSRVASSSEDCTVRVWEVASGAPVGGVLTGHHDVVCSVSMSGDGSYVAFGSQDRTVRLWDLASGTPVGKVLSGHENWVRCVSMSGDGSRVASGSDDYTVRVWEVASGAPVGDALTGHDDVVCSVCMDGDGSRVVSVSADRTLRLWSAVCGKCEKEMRYNDAESRAVADAAARDFLRGRTRPSVKIAVDGRFLVVGEGVPRRVAAFDDSIKAICFSDDGTRVVAGFRNGVVALLHVLT